MPNNTNKIVRPLNFLHDFPNYWYGTVVSLKGTPFRILEARSKEESRIPQSYEDLYVTGKVISTPSGRWKNLTVGGEELTYDFPRLGFVKSNSGWHYLYRNPQRKMIKGYSYHTVLSWFATSEGIGEPLDVMSESVLRQLFFGNPSRINSECIINDRGEVFYGPEHVGTINAEGQMQLVENHEKMGAVVCKLLENSSVAHNLYPNLTLPS